MTLSWSSLYSRNHCDDPRRSAVLFGFAEPAAADRISAGRTALGGRTQRRDTAGHHHQVRFLSSTFNLQCFNWQYFNWQYFNLNLHIWTIWTDNILTDNIWTCNNLNLQYFQCQRSDSLAELHVSLRAHSEGSENVQRRHRRRRIWSSDWWVFYLVVSSISFLFFFLTFFSHLFHLSTFQSFIFHLSTFHLSPFTFFNLSIFHLFDLSSVWSPCHFSLFTFDITDPTLLRHRETMIHTACLELARCKLIRYDPRTRVMGPTPQGSIASHYYLSCDR